MIMHIITNKKGFQIIVYDSDMVRTLWIVAEQIIDFSTKRDASDNIPGVGAKSYLDDFIFIYDHIE